MSYDHQIVCLANSRKWSGRCIAGKITEGTKTGQWLRPVGTTASHEITERDREYDDGTTAQKLDIIDITFNAPATPVSFQQENHVIDDGFYWVKSGQCTIQDLAALVDTPVTLWETGNHSYSGTNDRVSTTLLTTPRQTLYLIEPEDVQFSVKAEGAAFGNAKKVVRAHFRYNGTRYALTVTDPDTEQYYKAQPIGDYPAEVNYFTISLGEPYKGDAYKLVAAVF
ncbi:dual OB domain-containing protein [Pseudomonas aeruginosa]|uniref:dual OB domain-containing protein n=1 Tax=Pseudomonas aeruginosa TaxID=287 RepID=UPI00071BFD36|nr:hypothetical protein [Pseudomonas aeruginosa]KSR38318.1 hypothetical protein APB53_21730 [Pseudomonas aeruginosa]MBG7444451.1 hypothetical protein [Pseudomonas aeruginosa]MDU0517827.1 hypothetical protein [Pseudomonas aeruginosa]RPV10314.1 hypothetical protein IPC880_03835 [Pseudomonas aeruginosa]HBO5074398.1 hypothetical protein [Pseudomonas aeruginosa]